MAYSIAHQGDTLSQTLALTLLITYCPNAASVSLLSDTFGVVADPQSRRYGSYTSEEDVRLGRYQSVEEQE